MKMMGHLMYELGKSMIKCRCVRKRGGLRERINSKESLVQSKPIWMSSGFNFSYVTSPKNGLIKAKSNHSETQISQNN